MTEPARTSSTLRYAVLHHTGHGPSHYDLLFETAPGSPLLTFRSPAWPITDETQLERLADHRQMYLDYEGPVSGGRGDVRAVARGTHHLFHKATDRIVTFLTGSQHAPIRITVEARATPDSQST